MQAEKKVFVVVDPNDDRHIALERAVITSKFRSPSPKLIIFVAVDGEAVDTRARNDHLFRDESWFRDQIRKPVEEAGLECEIQVCWSSDWQAAIIQESKRSDAEMIYLPVHAKTTRRFTFADSKWQVLKKAKCPVVLIRPGAHDKPKVVLAAVNFQADKDKQKGLNREIIERAKYIASKYDAELHFVNGYLDSMLYPDRGALANQTGLPADRIHVEAGYTDEAVAKIAAKVNADLVVLGTLGQNGLPGSRRRGNTAERVIAALTQDIMVINSQPK